MASMLELILLMAPCGYLVLTSVNNLTITQSPSELQLLVGQSAEIICSWNVSSEVEQFRVQWKKVSHVQDSVTHPTKALKDNATLIKKNLYNRSGFTQGTGKEPLELKNLQVHDSGLYLCKITVDIPIYKHAQGPGTLLTVKEKNKKKQWPWWTLVIFLLLTFSACLSYYFKKRKNSKRIEPNRADQEEKEDTEYIEMKRKTKENGRTPSNTTEWAVSVLYESMTSFAKKPGEQIDDDIYTCLCSDPLQVLSPGPSAIVLTDSTGAPETPSDIPGKGRNLDLGYRQIEFSSEGTNLTRTTTKTTHEQTGLRGSQDLKTWDIT
ncbi:protein S100-P isoform X4 [Phascolarctos cinereus]